MLSRENFDCLSFCRVHHIMAPRVLAAALRFHLEAECYLNTHVHTSWRAGVRELYSPFLHDIPSKYNELLPASCSRRLTSDGSVIFRSPLICSCNKLNRQNKREIVARLGFLEFFLFLLFKVLSPKSTLFPRPCVLVIFF